MNAQKVPPESTAAEPPIRQAMNLTLDLITKRAGFYRNLVVCVTLLIGSTLILAIYFGNWRLLALATWMFPLVSFWLWSDQRLIESWSMRVQEICRQGKLDPMVFVSALRQLKHLPQRTIDGIVGCLTASLPDLDASSDSKKSGAENDQQSYLNRLLLFTLTGSTVATVGLYRERWEYCVGGLLVCIVSRKLADFLHRFLQR